MIANLYNHILISNNYTATITGNYTMAENLVILGHSAILSYCLTALGVLFVKNYLALDIIDSMADIIDSMAGTIDSMADIIDNMAGTIDSIGKYHCAIRYTR